MQQVLSDEDYDFLRKAERAALVGGMFRPEKTPQRDRLKRLGIIKSAPPNAGRRRQVVGHAHNWTLTDVGRVILMRKDEQCPRT